MIQSEWDFEAFERKRANKLSLIDQCPSNGPTKSILRAIDSLSRDSRKCQSTMRRLAGLMGCHSATARRRIQCAEDAGYLVVERTGKSQSTYTINWKQLWTSTPGFVFVTADASPTPVGSGRPHAANRASGGWPKVLVGDGVTRKHLLNPAIVQSLFDFAISKAWVRLPQRHHFFCAAAYACRKGSSPGKFFTWVVKQTEFAACRFNFTAVDELSASRMMGVLKEQRRQHDAEPTQLSPESSGSLDGVAACQQKQKSETLSPRSNAFKRRMTSIGKLKTQLSKRPASETQ